MDCMVRDGYPVRLYSQAKYGIEDSRLFYISASPHCFTEDDHPLRHGSSFNKQETVGGMITIDIAQVFFCVFIASIAVIFTFKGFVDLGGS